MNELIASLNSRLNLSGVSTTDRPRFLAAAVAIVLSRRAGLPTGPVDSPVNYYLINELQELQRAASVINEFCVIDLKATKTISEVLWMIRYQACYPQAYSKLDKTYGFFDSYVGTGEVVNADLHAFLNQYKTNFDVVLPAVAAIIDQ